MEETGTMVDAVGVGSWCVVFDIFIQIATEAREDKLGLPPYVQGSCGV